MLEPHSRGSDNLYLFQMNSQLRVLVKESGLNEPTLDQVRFDFCFACITRICHLLEADESIKAYSEFELYMNKLMSKPNFERLQKSILNIANQHPGSQSLDGARHSAVSATYALANAINGNAIATAEYAAYSKVYGYEGYAVNDLENYQDEYFIQVKILRDLIEEFESA